MESTDHPFTVASKGRILPAKLNAIHYGTKIEASCSVVTSMELENNSHTDLVVQKKEARKAKNRQGQRKRYER